MPLTTHRVSSEGFELRPRERTRVPLGMAAAEASLALRMVGAQRTLAFIEQTLLTLLGSAKPANLRILEVLLPLPVPQRTLTSDRWAADM